MRYLRIGIDIAPPSEPISGGGWVMINLEIYFSIGVVSVVLAVDVAAICVYRRAVREGKVDRAALSPSVGKRSHHPSRASVRPYWLRQNIEQARQVGDAWAFGLQRVVVRIKRLVCYLAALRYRSLIVDHIGTGLEVERELIPCRADSCIAAQSVETNTQLAVGINLNAVIERLT
jgi:hypothetical protein